MEPQQCGQQLNSSVHMQPEVSGSPHNFDLDMLDIEDENTFVAQQVITDCLEKHFRHTPKKANRMVMHKVHPVPRTTITNLPVVDQSVKDYLKSCFPAQEDGKLARLQSAMLKVCGPMSCLWSDLIKQNLLEDPNATISVHDVLEVVQLSLVLLGNANELLSQMRTKILQLADKSLRKYGEESPSQAREFLWPRIHQAPTKQGGI